MHSNVRGYYGAESRWYQAALRQKALHILAAGMTKEVAFERVNGSIRDGTPSFFDLLSARQRRHRLALILFHRQREPERGTLSELRLNPDPSAMAADDFPADR